MSQKLFSTNIFQNGISHRKDDIKITPTDIEFMSQLCLVQHVNLFPFSLAHDSYESDFGLLLYSDQFLVLDKAETSEKVSFLYAFRWIIEISR